MATISVSFRRAVFRAILYGLIFTAPAVGSAQTARAVVDTAIARMGGRVALDSIRTARYEMQTQWVALAIDDQPLRDAPSYERHSEWRDYKTRMWRNIRRTVGASLALREMTDLVVDSIGGRRLPPPLPAAGATATPAPPTDWIPLNIAYIDERRELFMWVAERLVLGLADAKDLRVQPDTVIGGNAHSRVSATLDGFPVTAFFRKSNGLPTAIRFVADEANDFGLAPWGRMEVEIWYSRWTAIPSGAILIPLQWDTKRVGRLYKRMTVLSAAFNPVFPADSITLPESVGTAFRAGSLKPMGDRPIDSATVVAGGAAIAFFGTGAPAGAVRVGDTWMFLDGGNLPVNAERAAAWIAANAPGGAKTVSHALLTANRPASVAVWAARKGDRVYASNVGSVAAQIALKNHQVSTANLQTVQAGRWLTAPKGTAKDSIWVEPIDAANGSGLLLYVPANKWAYSGALIGTADLRLAAAALRKRGFQVDLISMPGRMVGLPAPR